MESSSWKVRGQLGIQFEHFGGVTKLDDGFALVVGLASSLDVASGIRIGVTGSGNYLAIQTSESYTRTFEQPNRSTW